MKDAGSRGRGKGWRPLEEQDMLTCVADIVPVDSTEWDDVAIAFNFHRLKGDRRDVSAIKRKFRLLCTLSPHSAGLTNRDHIAQAKRIQSDIDRKKTCLRRDTAPSEPQENATAADTGILAIPNDLSPSHNSEKSPVPAPPLSSPGDSASAATLRPAQLAALGRTITTKRPNMPPTRRQVMEAMRILHPDQDTNVHAAPTDEGTDTANGSMHPAEGPAARHGSRSSALHPHRPPKRRRRSSASEDDSPSIMSMLWMLEKSREKWLRQIEERREMWEKEREDRREARHIEREQREREREAFRDQIELRREERAAKMDQILALVLTKLMGSTPASRSPE
ncbi:hypothetical protein, variant [Aphanomyces invadans]|uniref:Uncharacterized protein n=1 Tax=Aphanomyces invadans TaxID=157072 RepID=A0A024TCS3_9STRA|nr:hypothetical protein, variant [Aphanomyces invadans]ETV91814.1 hypothetical protein, variant [Aphanomyces invadans]|eukprot:XP_008879451.1 hypothetical protein, variant [Aphanomyces invadans]